MVENAYESSYDHTKNHVLSAPKQWFSMIFWVSSNCPATSCGRQRDRRPPGQALRSTSSWRIQQGLPHAFGLGDPVSPMIFFQNVYINTNTQLRKLRCTCKCGSTSYSMWCVCVSNGIHCKEKRRCWSRCNTCCPNLKILFLFGGVGSPLSTTSAVTDHHTPLPGALPCCWATWRGYKRFARHQCGVSYLHIQWMQRGWSYTSEEVCM